MSIETIYLVLLCGISLQQQLAAEALQWGCIDNYLYAAETALQQVA